MMLLQVTYDYLITMILDMCVLYETQVLIMLFQITYDHLVTIILEL